MANQEIRNAAKAKGVSLWALADKLGVSEATMTRMLRHELDGERKQAILALIRDGVEV